MYRACGAGWRPAADCQAGFLDVCSSSKAGRLPIGPQAASLPYKVLRFGSILMKCSSALITLSLLQTAHPANESTLRGFSAESSRAERAWETKYAAIPEPMNMRDYMQRLAARPHHVGSPYDKDNAEWILAKLKSWGLDAKIEIFEVLFPTPKDRALELLEPERFEAKLQEPAVPADPTSS